MRPCEKSGIAWKKPTNGPGPAVTVFPRYRPALKMLGDERRTKSSVGQSAPMMRGFVPSSITEWTKSSSVPSGLPDMCNRTVWWY